MPNTEKENKLIQNFIFKSKYKLEILSLINND